MERQHPDQQHSSLGISKVLQKDIETGHKQAMTDDMFKVPHKGSNIFIWTRFMISLYYNKIVVGLFGYITGWRWYNRIDARLILGALPTPSQIKKLHAVENVSTIINMCAEFPGYERLYHELNIKQIRLETPDFTLPTLHSIHAAINEINQSSSSVYLHCKAGRGRSAAIALCYLMRVYQLNLSEGQEVLMRKRVQVDKNICQTEEVRLFYKELLSDMEAGRFQRVEFALHKS
ncbi:phosphatases II, partial [Backusella circina FSU 941]